MSTPVQLFTAILMGPTGLLDFCTYHHKQCAVDTINDSPVAQPGLTITLVTHDDDGSFLDSESWVIAEKGK